jgi:predicted outer membrane repeat protein
MTSSLYRRPVLERRTIMSFFSRLRNRTSTRPARGPAQHRPTTHRFRPRLEALQDRWLLSTLTVTNNLDSGAGSLRADIAAAHSGDTIVFAPNLNGQTITLTSSELSITKGLTIQGPGAGQLTVSGHNFYRVFEVNASQPVVLSGLTMTGGNTFGGAIFNHTVLAVRGCNITGNAQYGGGIYNAGSATLTVSGCSLNGASASDYGGGIYNFGTLTVSQSTLARDTADIFGGGIYNRGTLTVSASTLSSNSAFGGGGGGIYSTDRSIGLTTLTNCTFSGNSAYRGQGGGLFVGRSATVTNCTFSLNSAVQGEGGGIYVNGPSGILNLTNTIVAGNTAGRGPDIYGAVATADHNLVGDASGSTGIVNGVNGNIVGGNSNPVINADLGPLQDNGGPTETMALLTGSPAIGNADNTLAPATDQRGVTRSDLAGELTDIGAFEL